ncbi:TniB family NTP-binding protein [Neptuniibacter sp.]|uniref:TniB family NTP-binding protein n=1 Tax=Neptuniibacter sp. TaxID=1962643 RepID=UPI0026140A3E|nr:TniB family NTP-binding protein [Neptuniibacter sp.]MCP4597953.1 AAA family ATPase [Neptuniibacter sp.]
MQRDHLETIARFKKTVIPHPQYVSAFEQIVQAYELNEQVGFQQNLICIGVSGTGKSTLKRKFYDQYPVIQTELGKRIPVLVIDTPSIPTVKNMAEAVLLQLGDPNFNKGSAIEKTGRILNYMKACEVKLVIIDELQHFIDQGNKAAPRQVSDWLKSLIDNSGASTVLMGLKRSEHILEINEQLRRRFSRRVDLKPFSIANQESFWDFFRVIKALDSVLMLPQPLELSEDLVHRFHCATNGVIGYAVNLIISAYQVAVRKKQDGLNLQCLEQAFTESIWLDGTGCSNPFNPSFKEKSLTKFWEPFNSLPMTECEK